MSVQTALGAVLLVGLPLLLLALGVLAHAYYVARPRNAARTDRLIEDLIAESMDELIAELRQTTGRIEGDSRVSPPRLAPAPAMHGFSALAPASATLPPTAAAGPSTTQRPAAPPSLGPVHLGVAVVQLLAEGLSDRSIARRLGVGIEEVRAARINRSTRIAA